MPQVGLEETPTFSGGRPAEETGAYNLEGIFVRTRPAVGQIPWPGSSSSSPVPLALPDFPPRRGGSLA